MRKNLRIAINAQIPPLSGAGGIETVLRLLATLGELDGDEEYVFVGHPDGDDWLGPLMRQGQNLVRAPRQAPAKTGSARAGVGQLLGPLRPVARRLRNSIFPSPGIANVFQRSDGFFESLDCDVIHFPYQDYVSCRMPSIYNPHDLQHIHLPHFFTEAERERRAAIYPAPCRDANTVVVASRFVKQDIIDHFGIDAKKIQIIPWSPPPVDLTSPSVIEITDLLEKYDCPSGPYVLYPAMTWEHKNHIRLIEALAGLRDRDGIKINLICTGHRTPFYAQIETRLKELKIEDQIRFTGMVEYDELGTLYRSAEFVIIPTLFEAGSAPLFEAWQYGAPVACSSVTALPDQAGDAAFLFDPGNVCDIANALKAMLFNNSLRAELKKRGYERLACFDLSKTAKSYRAVYRRAAGLKLNDEDIYLLS